MSKTQYLDKVHAALKARVSERTIQRAVISGELRCHRGADRWGKIWIHPRDLQGWVAARAGRIIDGDRPIDQQAMLRMAAAELRRRGWLVQSPEDRPITLDEAASRYVDSLTKKD